MDRAPPLPRHADAVQFATVCDLLDALTDRKERRRCHKARTLRQWRERYLSGVREHPPDVAAPVAAPRSRKKKYAPPPPPATPYDPVKQGDVFSIYRLLLPKLDGERRMGVKDSKLATALCHAAGVDPLVHADAKAVVDWRTRGGAHSRRRATEVAEAAGSLVDVACERLFQTRCMFKDGADAEYSLTVGELNRLLDAVAAAGTVAAMGAALRALMTRTSPRTMAWACRAMLKEVPTGMSRDAVLNDWHPHAAKAMLSLSNLRRVLAATADPASRHERATIELGAAARPQKGEPVATAAEALDRVGGGPFVVETKLDGFRIQAHVSSGAVTYFSPAGADDAHAERLRVLDAAVLGSVVGGAAAPLVLDGEVVVWNRASSAFDPFGGIIPVAIAAASDDTRGGAPLASTAPRARAMLEYDPPAAADLVLVYAPFDVLRVGDDVIADRPLSERHKVLRSVLGLGDDDASPPTTLVSTCIPLGPAGVIHGRVEPLLPGRPFMGGEPQSALGSTAADVEAAFQAGQRRGDEGVMVKSLASPWTPGGKKLWCKVREGTRRGGRGGRRRARPARPHPHHHARLPRTPR